MRSPVQSRVPLQRRFRLLGGFHSWRSFLFLVLGLRYGLRQRKNQCAKVQHIIRGQYKKTEGLLIIMHNFL